MALHKSLEKTLNEVFMQARQTRDKFMTPEHLLLGLLENLDFSELFEKLQVSESAMSAELKDHIAQHGEKLGADPKEDTQPTIGFQRCLQRAVFHVQSSGKKKEVNAMDVLVALLSEADSFAKKLMEQHGLTRASLSPLLPEVRAAGSGQSAEYNSELSKRESKLLLTKVFEIQQNLDTATQMIQDLDAKMDRLIEKLNNTN